jgi:hypothetical protein
MNGTLKVAVSFAALTAAGILATTAHSHAG